MRRVITAFEKQSVHQTTGLKDGECEREKKSNSIFWRFQTATQPSSASVKKRLETGGGQWHTMQLLCRWSLGASLLIGRPPYEELTSISLLQQLKWVRQPQELFTGQQKIQAGASFSQPMWFINRDGDADIFHHRVVVFLTRYKKEAKNGFIDSRNLSF